MLNDSESRNNDQSLAHPKTLADLERKGLNTEIPAISYGGSRYEFRKLKLLANEVSLQAQHYASEKPQADNDIPQLKQENLPETFQRQLDNLRNTLGEENEYILKGFLRTVSTLEKFNRFDLFRRGVGELTWTGKPPHLSGNLQVKPDSSSSTAQLNPSSTPWTPPIPFPQETYIERQLRLFRQSFSSLYEEYPEQYVLFHEGKVIFSGENILEVTKVAYDKRKVKDIFIKKVSTEEDTIEMLTPVE
jgi:hypothetical protein